MSVIFIKTNIQDYFYKDLSGTIISLLLDKKRVLWLVPGGSNIPISVLIMDDIRKSVSEDDMKNLSVSLTDERYGDIGHSDSNWKQLHDAHFNIQGVKILPVLENKPLSETVKNFDYLLENTLPAVDFVIGQFGIGADGHIAGVLPHTEGIMDKRNTIGYKSEAYTRISVTLNFFKKIDKVFVFAFGDSKKEALTLLRTKNTTIEDTPSMVLYDTKEAFVYSDQSI